ncbi:RluA family pseudouridine synthase [Candidatus Galacturonibacter soehngenii]|uniref:Pseudouridine synthase n=1 Tax=Candidatus Galacturonatibacter soehngenii TaxID=2307010 RepID=A0A7V7QMY0_9FIRM|nr:RluA family pseudouridine synthase [Candidatus Galacturonibacter soehngenii]KAB1440116.1 RluA family pseudouridine synthase [Candidatus Galacturonibacter soehngenii]
MNRTFIYKIDDAYDGYKIGDFLRKHLYSRQLIIHLKKTEQGILLNNTWAYINDLLHTNDVLTIQIIEESSSDNIVPVKMELDIVYEDEDIVIINKASNTPIHPSMNNYDNSLANGLAYYYESQNLPFVFRCVNRLDKDTSGLVLLAKNMYSSCILSEMVRNREIHREYLALVEGKLNDNGTIDAPVARKEGSVIERCIDFDHGQTAITHYSRLDYKNDFSLASIVLETGRTHQIRVHMKYIEHPLPGDFIYNPVFTHINRQALHSHKLSFVHPITKEAMAFVSPLPQDMKKLIE